MRASTLVAIALILVGGLLILGPSLGLFQITENPLESVQFTYRGNAPGGDAGFQVQSVGCHQSPTLYCTLDWDFGNGRMVHVSYYYGDPQQTFHNSYTVDGTFTVKLVAKQGNLTTAPPATVTFTVSGGVMSPESGTSTKSEVSTVGASGAITASFTYQATSGRSVAFDAGASGGAPPYTFHWEFGDGKTANDTGGSITHTYLADGTYSVRMTATDANGKVSDAKTASITFSGGSCTANCGGSGSGTAGLSTIVQYVGIGLIVVGIVILLVRRFR